MHLTTENILILALIAISLISIIGVLINRIKEEKGIGIRAIQFAIVTVLVPLVMALTILKILPPSTVAVIVGIIIGYAFSKADENKAQKTSR